MFGLEGFTIAKFIITIIAMMGISALFSIFGRGGGEFKLPVLITVLTMLPYFDIATISLFCIFVQGVTMLVVYGSKHKLVDWPLAFALAVIVGTFAFMGGYFSFKVEALYLKGTFAVLLLISAYFMWKGKGVPGRPGKFGVWHRTMANGEEYDMNLLLVVLPVGIVAFIAGMVGISGCGLIIPICIILGAMPIRIAIGTNTMLVLTSSATSFLGHAVRGTTPWTLTLILGAAAVCGAFIGANLHIDIPDKYIKAGFITLLIVASVWMMAKIYIL